MFEDKWIFVILIIALLFGASRLPMLGRNFGAGIKEFKKGLAESQRDDKSGAKAEQADKAEAAIDQPEAARPASGSSDENGAGA
ncbi:MAG TPA: twin-arginine translocase TatA/TatE family subunit [Actinomycetota bacterium]